MFCFFKFNDKRHCNFFVLPLITIVIQIIVLILISLWFLLQSNITIAMSVLCGGLISIFSTLFFVIRLWPLYQKSFMRHSMMHLYQAWIGRFVLTIALFITVFLVIPPVSPKAFFIAFIIITLLQAVVALLLTACAKPRLAG